MSSTPSPGARLGPYQVVRELGRGGMGVVFEAVDGALERRVALKLISPDHADLPGFRERFTREARVQASLDSPHVVTVFAHGEVDGHLFLATRLHPDGDLGALLRRRGGLPAGDAAQVVAQVAAGLADAHAVGLVHRDIKPANVLLRVRGDALTAYVADFGVACRAGAPVVPGGEPVGTPRYTAPELLAGDPPTPASDVYSLGCLLRTALGPGARPRRLERVLRRALAPDPADRYPTAAGFRDALRSTGPGRFRVRLALGAAAALAAAAAVVVLPGDGPRAPTDPRQRLDAPAVAGLARRLAADGTVSRADAACVARRLLDATGPAQAGRLRAADAGVLRAVVRAGASCILEAPAGRPD